MEFNYSFYEAIEKAMTGKYKIIGEIFSNGHYRNFYIQKRGVLVLVNTNGSVFDLRIDDWIVDQKYAIIPIEDE